MTPTTDTRHAAPAQPSPAIARRVPLLRQLAACRDGATLVEFALVLPILLTFILGMFEVAMVMFVATSVEGGLREAARYGITGQGDTPQERQDAIMDILENYTFGFVDIDAADVSFFVYDSFTNVGKPEPWTDTDGDGVKDGDGVAPTSEWKDVNGNGKWDDDQGKAGLGDAGAVVRYSIEYDWKLITPFVSALVGDYGVFHMGASITVRNEPYSFTTGTGG